MNDTCRILLSLLLMGGCATSPPAEAPPVVQVSPGPAETGAARQSRAPKPVVVAAVRPPGSLSIDGDIGEWGPFGGQEGAPGPRGSSLVFGLDQRGLHLAAELGEGEREGIWLGLATTPPEVHPIGQGWENGLIEEIDCERGGHLQGARWVPDGKEASPESREACKALHDGHAKLTAEHRRRFSRLFKIDREGVREVTGSGDLVSIAGASAVWKAGPAGARVEVSLPLLALPRAAEAPLGWLGVWARAATAAPPEIAAEDARVVLPDPVSFEPHGALRSRVLGSDEHHVKWSIRYRTAGQSYQPGDPLHIESMHHDGPSKVVLREGALFEKAASLGDVEVGYVHAFHEHLAIFKGGKLLSLVEPRPMCTSGIGREDTCGCDWEASWEGMVTRDGAIHAFLRHKGGGATLACGVEGSRPGGWSVLVIAPDGTHREADEDARNAVPHVGFCREGTGSASEARDTFTWRGECFLRGSDKKVDVEMTKRWDGAKKKYVATWKGLPAAPKKQ